MERKKRMKYAMFCGILGCLCFGGGDWLMMYGNPSHSSSLFWLTDGVTAIPAWRNNLAMALSFPGIILYGIALFSLAAFLKDKTKQRRYRILTVSGLTPWLALHLFYIMILYLYAWMNQNGYASSAVEVCEALYGHLGWVVIVSEIIMLPPFLYWFYLTAAGFTDMPQIMALVNPLVFYLILYLGKSILPDSAFRIGFTNGLMSESMILCFAIWGIWSSRHWNE